MKGRDFIGLDEYSRDETELILARAVKLKKELREGRIRQSLLGKSAAMVFEKASTRTRVSFQVGVAQLGGHPVFLPGKELQLSRGEPVKDMARVLSRYVDAVVVRANNHEDVLELAEYSDAPVINGLTDLLHPCQIMADLFTIREAGKDLDHVRVAYIGDGNNVANSWVNAAGIYEFELLVACPEGYEPDGKVLEAARERGGNIEIVRDPLEAAGGADVLYTDVWVSMGQDEEGTKRRETFKNYQIGAEAVERAKSDVIVMHCLPAHRGEEITEEALEGERSVVFDQAENRLHVQKAILELVIGE